MLVVIKQSVIKVEDLEQARKVVEAHTSNKIHGTAEFEQILLEAVYSEEEFAFLSSF